MGTSPRGPRRLDPRPARSYSLTRRQAQAAQALATPPVTVQGGPQLGITGKSAQDGFWVGFGEHRSGATLSVVSTGAQPKRGQRPFWALPRGVNGYLRLGVASEISGIALGGMT